MCRALWGMVKILVFTCGVTGNLEVYEQKVIILHFITGSDLKNRQLGGIV